MRVTGRSWRSVGGWLLVLGAIVAAACSPAAQQTAISPLATYTPTAAVQVVAFVTAAPSAVTALTPGSNVTPTPTPLGASETSPAAAVLTGTVAPGVAVTVPVTASLSGALATPIPTSAPIVFPPRPPNENPLTGLIVDDPTVLQRRPIHVRVGNDVAARPQAGLSAADLVYEEIVEWWVTRYTAIYLSQSPEVVAPIRSARLINCQLTQQYNAALSNSGGSDGVRWELSKLPIVNLDEYFWPQPYFYRPNEGWQTRLALNVKQARQLMAKKGLEANVPLRGFVFSDTPPAGEPAQTIYIPYPKRTSIVEWRYDPGAGRYLRWVQGQPLIDVTNKTQISAANVIIYYAEHQETNIVEDSNGATSIRIIVNGEGRAQVFRDGIVVEGRWRAEGNQTPEFLFPNGEAIPLKRGNSWIEVVPPKYQVLINATPTPAAG